jgi:uncharacterized hydantoinase/oxoprolinase family protein
MPHQIEVGGEYIQVGMSLFIITTDEIIRVTEVAPTVVTLETVDGCAKISREVLETWLRSVTFEVEERALPVEPA